LSSSTATDPAVLRHLLHYPGAVESALAASLAAFEAAGGQTYVATVNGVVRASMGIKRRTWEFSGEPFLCVQWLFSQGAGEGRELLRLLLAIGRRSGLPVIFFQTSGDRPAAFGRLMRQMGGELIGGGYRFAAQQN
jgi:hypothetical protein